MEYSFFKYLVKKRKIIAVLSTTIILLVVPILLTNLKTNNEISIWFSPNDPTLLKYHQFHKKYGNDRVMLIIYPLLEPLSSVLQQKKIAHLKQILEETDGVSAVYSVYQAKDFLRVKKSKSYRIEYGSYFNFFTINARDDTWQDKLLSSPLLKNRFINEEGNLASLLIRFEPNNYFEKNRDTIIKSIIDVSETAFNGQKIYFGGLEMITYRLNQLSKKDFALFLGGCFILIFLAILLFYRSLLFCALAFSVCISAIVITFALYSYLGYSLNLFSVVIPAIIITLGVINVLHIINHHRLLVMQQPNINALQILAISLKGVFIPCLYTNLTTMIGFLSLLGSSTAVLKEFGIFAAIGIGLAFIYAFIYSPFFLFFAQTKTTYSKSERATGLLIKNLNRVNQKPSFIAYTSIFIIVIAIIGISKINIDMFPLGYFPKQHSVIKDHEFIRKNWGEYLPVDLLIRGEKEGTLFTPEKLEKVNAFEKALLTHRYVGDVVSPLQLLERYAQVAFKDSLISIINNPIKAPLYIKSFKKVIDKHHIDVMDKDLSEIKITIIGPALSTKELAESIKVIEALAIEHLGAKLKLELVGYPTLFVKVMHYAFTSMKNSLLIAFCFIFISLYLLTKDIRLTVLAIIPNVFPLLVMLGLLGLTDINLDLTTSTVASIALGIAIDDTIHFMHSFKHSKNKGLSINEALKIALTQVGSIIIISSFITILGFSVLLLASIKTAIYFGTLMIIAIFAALFGDLLLLPLLLKKFY